MPKDFSQIPSQFDDILEGHPIVFISYSRDSDAHRTWVKKLSDDLRTKYSINTLLDQYNRGGYDLISFMTKAINMSDRVLLIGTPEYKRKTEQCDKGGVKYEDQLISIEIYNKMGTMKFVPILREGKFNTSFSSLIETRTGYIMSDGCNYEDTLRKLAADLWNNPLNAAPALGPRPVFANSQKKDTPSEQIIETTPEQFVADIKQLLSSPNNEIALTEMIEDEGKIVCEKIISKAQYNFNITPETFKEYASFHLKAVTKLVSAAIVIVRYGTLKQQSLLIDVLVRLCMKPYRNNEVTVIGTSVLHLFAASFLFHAVGVSCVRYGDYQILPKMMTCLVPVGHALSYSHEYSLSNLAGTIHWQPDHMNIYMDSNWYYPYSEFVSRNLKSFFNDCFINDDEFREYFAIWERLFSLMYVYYKSSPYFSNESFPKGLFLSESVVRNVLVKRGRYYQFFSSALVDKDNWEPLKQGLFEGEYIKYKEISERADNFFRSNRLY